MYLGLRNLQTSEGRDGVAFSAKLTVGGRVAGSVRNDGNGGCSFYTYAGDTPEARTASREAVTAAMAQAAEVLDLPASGVEWQDQVVWALLDEIEMAKTARKAARRGYAGLLVADEFDADQAALLGRPVYGASVVYRITTPEHVAQVVANHPNARVTAYLTSTASNWGALAVGASEVAWRTAHGLAPARTASRAAYEAQLQLDNARRRKAAAR